HHASTSLLVVQSFLLVVRSLVRASPPRSFAALPPLRLMTGDRKSQLRSDAAGNATGLPCSRDGSGGAERWPQAAADERLSGTRPQAMAGVTTIRARVKRSHASGDRPEEGRKFPALGSVWRFRAQWAASPHSRSPGVLPWRFVNPESARRGIHGSW